MKITEIRELTIDELTARSRELNQELFNLRLQRATGQLEKPSQVTQIRREVARVETILSERRNNAAK